MKNHTALIALISLVPISVIAQDSEPSHPTITLAGSYIANLNNDTGTPVNIIGQLPSSLVETKFPPPFQYTINASYSFAHVARLIPEVSFGLSVDYFPNNSHGIVVNSTGVAATNYSVIGNSITIAPEVSIEIPEIFGVSPFFFAKAGSARIVYTYSQTNGFNLGKARANNFSYEYGLGLKRNLGKKVALEASYSYANNGTITGNACSGSRCLTQRFVGAEVLKLISLGLKYSFY